MQNLCFILLPRNLRLRRREPFLLGATGPLMISQRELARLSSNHLTDGQRGLQKPSTRDRSAAISSRLRSLFFSGDTSAASTKMHPVHSEPNVYVLPHFLTPRELDHMDSLITARRGAFKDSHTDAIDGKQVHVEERTSISLFLPKSADGILRTVEARAADAVGLPADHVEPLQVVYYNDGAKFDMHHDVAPIVLKGDDEWRDADAAPDESPRLEGSPPLDGSQRSGGTPDASPRRRAAAADDGLLSADAVRVESQDGPRRLVTLFVYLNTLPEGVGHTEFPLLRGADGGALSVRPRAGTALLFCNVDEAGEPDARLCHRACPVPLGHVKFGVNIWITDVSQQMHVLAAPPSRKPLPASRGGGGGRPRAGLLAPHLYVQPDDYPPPPPAALVGLTIARRFGSLGVFEGTVAAHCPVNGYRIEYVDGDEEDLGADDLLSTPLAAPADLVGRRVGRYFIGHGRFEGEVVGCDEARREYTVRYDDGDAEDQLPLAEVLRLLLPPQKRSRGKAAAKARKRKC